jgi:hypothetical protein
VTRTKAEIQRALNSCLLTAWVWALLSKYWIFVCAALFLLMALQEAVAYRIIYMVLFLYFIITFQLSYTFWRFCVKAFWTVVILYSMVVLLTLYVFQFDDILERWHNATGMSPDLMADIGLEQFDRGQLFVNLLTPTSFLIFIILHLHYFQRTFLQLSDVNRYKEDTMAHLRDLPVTSEGEGAEGLHAGADPTTSRQKGLLLVYLCGVMCIC